MKTMTYPSCSPVLPILYSFRRCPYAMRARLALAYSGVETEHREVVLKDKPSTLLAISPKGTVPVLQLGSGEVIEESIDIMHWALRQRDECAWLSDVSRDEITGLIAHNDTEFKYWLDRYKYADRYPEYSMGYYRTKCEEWIRLLEKRLGDHGGFLMGSAYTLADMAIFPFIRQCAHVDRAWFDESPYPCVKLWLAQLIDSDLFASIMVKYPQWKV